MTFSAATETSLTISSFCSLCRTSQSITHSIFERCHIQNKTKLMTHLLYSLVQHCSPERCLHSVGPNSEQNSWWVCRSVLSAANSPANCCGVYPLSMYRAKRQQYSPQTVVVDPWSCVLLYCQTVQLLCMKSRMEGICGWRP